MDTAPLPQVQHGPDRPPGSDAPTERISAVPTHPSAGDPELSVDPGPYLEARPDPYDDQQPGAGLRIVEVVAGLLSGGLLIVGLALLALQFVAPDLAPGTGLATPSGPGWWRVAAQLGVGVAGELVVLARRRAPRPWRYLLASLMIVGALAVLWFAWWA